jgi:lactate dehydrogenase-like 2-hydroxyacid dehydrogenase
VPIEILSTHKIHKSAEEAMPKYFTVHRLPDGAERAAFLKEVGPRIRGATGWGIDKATIDALPALEIYANAGVGYDGVDISACKARGIKVTNTPDVLNDAMAEITLGLMIALSRQIVAADRYVRDGRWKKDGNYAHTTELTGRTVGILGLGRIGKEIAARCTAMKMRVVYHGRSEQAHQPYVYYKSLAAMAKDVDVLVVVAPGGAETRGIVSREVIAALGPDGMLVNVARGTLVDEAALVEALVSGKLGGAALDVFEDEPNVPEALVKLDNVVLSPHQGSATFKTRDAMGDLVVANLRAHFDGKPLLTPVA